MPAHCRRRSTGVVRPMPSGTSMGLHGHTTCSDSSWRTDTETETGSLFRDQPPTWMFWALRSASCSVTWGWPWRSKEDTLTSQESFSGTKSHSSRPLRRMVPRACVILSCAAFIRSLAACMARQCSSHASRASSAALQAPSTSSWDGDALL
jgi:hypothetical protein